MRFACVREVVSLTLVSYSTHTERQAVGVNYFGIILPFRLYPLPINFVVSLPPAKSDAITCVDVALGANICPRAVAFQLRIIECDGDLFFAQLARFRGFTDEFEHSTSSYAFRVRGKLFPPLQVSYSTRDERQAFVANY